LFLGSAVALVVLVGFVSIITEPTMHLVSTREAARPIWFIAAVPALILVATAVSGLFLLLRGANPRPR
jgi:predicted signal transduction protein with EAL and GGDEF domain